MLLAGYFVNVRTGTDSEREERSTSKRVVLLKILMIYWSMKIGGVHAFKGRKYIARVYVVSDLILVM